MSNLERLSGGGAEGHPPYVIKISALSKGRSRIEHVYVCETGGKFGFLREAKRFTEQPTATDIRDAYESAVACVGEKGRVNQISIISV